MLVLANGLGGPITAFRHQLSHFAGRYDILSWDYRGLYGSRGGRPPDRVDVAAHAEDLEELMNVAGVERGIFVGWSMGVQVVLELCARAPERASELVLINGTGGRPLASTRLPRAEHWLPGLIEQARTHHRLGSRFVARVSRSKLAADWVRRLHIVSPRLASGELLEIAQEFGSIDFEVYFRTLRALHEHDVTHDLGRVTARTLVMTGSRDPVFAPRIATELVRRLPNAELYVVPRGTHYAPVEFPELVNARIDAFLARPRTPAH